LSGVQFEIDGGAAVFAVGGVGRIEKYLMPLLFVLLERHAQIIMLCKEYILDPRELQLATDSLSNVIEEVYHRIRTLKDGFTAQRVDLDQTFQYFAAGLYDDLYRLWFRDSDSDSETEEDWEEEEAQQDEATDPAAVNADGTAAATDGAAKPDGDKPAASGDPGATGVKVGEESAPPADEGKETEDGAGEQEGDEDADGAEDGEGSESASARPTTPTTIDEEVTPLSVELLRLRYPAKKAEKEAIEALQAKLDAAKKAEEEKEKADGEGEGGGDEDKDKEEDKDKDTPPEPPKTVEERLASLEETIGSIEENIKELLSRVPRKRR